MKKSLAVVASIAIAALAASPVLAKGKGKSHKGGQPAAHNVLAPSFASHPSATVVFNGKVIGNNSNSNYAGASSSANNFNFAGGSSPSKKKGGWGW